MFVPSESLQVEEANTAVEIGPFAFSFDIKDYAEYADEIRPMFFMENAAHLIISDLNFQYVD